MAIDVTKLKNWPFAPIEQRYSARDTILYALGLGAGQDPLDRAQLRFVRRRAQAHRRWAWCWATQPGPRTRPLASTG